MSDTLTAAMTQTSAQLVEPEVGASVGSWGGKLNTDLADIVAEVNAISSLLATTKTTADAALPKAGGAMTGRVDQFAERGGFFSVGTLGSTMVLDLSKGDYFDATMGSASVTQSFTNVPSSGSYVLAVVVRIVNGGAHPITWAASVRWPSGGAPSLTVSGTDLVGFISYDGGTTWYGVPVLDLR
jgi:hypothetical protein